LQLARKANFETISKTVNRGSIPNANVPTCASAKHDFPRILIHQGREIDLSKHWAKHDFPKILIDRGREIDLPKQCAKHKFGRCVECDPDSKTTLSLFPNSKQKSQRN
jgi:hypothetical protein